jgi:hypothetical protein
MWIFTETGYISAVRKGPNPNELSVRSRDRKSLEELAEVADVEIIKTPNGDYPYRVFVDEIVFAKWFADQALNIDYSNFKSRVFDTRGYEYAHELSRVWSVMLDTEDEDSRNQ